MIAGVVKQALRRDLLPTDSRYPLTKAATEFIIEHTHLTIEQLELYDLNFETLLDALLLLKPASEEDRQRFSRTYWGLYTVLAGTLEAFNHWEVQSRFFRALGRIIVDERAPVITFNYDTYIETAISLAASHDSARLHQAEIEQADFAKGSGHSAGPRPPPLRKDFGVSNWRRELAYGVEFDEIQTTDYPFRNRFRRGEFYPSAPPNRVDIQVLKMHGSLNWFRYTGQLAVAAPVGTDLGIQTHRAGSTLLKDAFIPTGFLPTDGAEYLEPMLITPNQLKREAVKEEPYASIWRRAGEILRKSKRLVAIGYSFSDDHMIDFIRDEVDFSALEELAIVVPSTKRARKIEGVLGTRIGHQHFTSVEDYVAARLCSVI